MNLGYNCSNKLEKSNILGRRGGAVVPKPPPPGYVPYIFNGFEQETQITYWYARSFHFSLLHIRDDSFLVKASPLSKVNGRKFNIAAKSSKLCSVDR